MNLKSKILIITIILFISTMGFYNYYIIQLKNKFITDNMNTYNKEFSKTYQAIQDNIHKTLSKRIKNMIDQKNHYAIVKILKGTANNKSKKHIVRHFAQLQTELKFLDTFHLFDKNGISLLGVHDNANLGDDLTNYRASIRQVVKNPQSISFFENGIFGLYFRVIEPVYENKKLLGFVEFGLKPRVFMERIKQFMGLDSFIFLEKNIYDKIDKNILSGIEPIEFGDYKFFSRCDVGISILRKIPSDYKLTDDIKYNIDKKVIMTHTINIEDINGNKIGVFLSFQDFTEIEDEYKDFFITSFIVSIFFIVLVFGLLEQSYSKLTVKIDKYLYTLDKIKDSIFVIDISNHKIIFSNETARKSLGYTKKEFSKLKLEQFSIPTIIDDDIICKENIEKIKQSNESFIKRAFNRSKDGSLTPVEISFSYVKSSNKEYLVSICRDINKQLKEEQKYKANEKVINEYVPISQTDLDGNITYVNDAFCNLVGYEKDELIGQNHRLLRHPDTKELLYQNLWSKLLDDKSWKGVLRNIRKDDEVIWANVTIEPMYNHLNKKIGYISTRENISDKKELEYMSDHDILTKAKNRRSFERELHKQIKNAHRYKDKDFGLVMFDIDHFKNVNDTYGHQIGDTVLTNLSEAIHCIIRESDFFARWGGEEFVILCSHTTNEDLALFVEKIRDELKKVKFLPVPQVTVSFGVTLYTEDDTIESIQQRADKALYKAKENGRDRYEIL